MVGCSKEFSSPGASDITKSYKDVLGEKSAVLLSPVTEKNTTFDHHLLQDVYYELNFD